MVQVNLKENQINPWTDSVVNFIPECRVETDTSINMQNFQLFPSISVEYPGKKDPWDYHLPYLISRLSQRLIKANNTDL